MLAVAVVVFVNVTLTVTVAVVVNVAMNVVMAVVVTVTVALTVTVVDRDRDRVRSVTVTAPRPWPLRGRDQRHAFAAYQTSETPSPLRSGAADYNLSAQARVPPPHFYRWSFVAVAAASENGIGRLRIRFWESSLHEFCKFLQILCISCKYIARHIQVLCKFLAKFLAKSLQKFKLYTWKRIVEWESAPGYSS